MKTSLTKAYNNASHRSQVLVSELAAKSTKKGKGGRGGGGGAGGDLDEETAGLLGEDALDELALLAPAEDDGDEDISALLAKSRKPSAAAAKKASAAGKAAAGGAGAGAGKGKAKGGKAGGK